MRPRHGHPLHYFLGIAKTVYSEVASNLSIYSLCKAQLDNI
jgi:hypothetical protein